ncbi:potassium channel family protein [Thermodesulfovibrio sp.]|jgi:voltage-gated potassium channel|uniref:Potassium channel protein n=1 Tax=Thermodesulfovibrio aggregans TaxID=86166 RepID=A0A2J6WI28_9BACT|nr:MAG: potassium channel protein [Thermodesulfovibrio aggregans]
MNLIRRKFVLILLLIIAVLVFGTAGYMIIEDMKFIDAFYMTVITLATVGFKEVKDLDEPGKIFTIILILNGFGIFTYSLTTGAKIIIEGEIKEVFKKRRMRKKIDGLAQHYIVCGYGRMGSIIVKELKANNMPVVVIEKNKINLPEDEEFVYVEGDATHDDVLKSAGIEKAKGLITVLPSDAENLYVVLSARELNPDLFIVARAIDKEAESKLKRAGADKVVSPYFIGGLRIAHTILRPTVVDFIEFATRSEHIEIQIEEIKVSSGSGLVGKTIAQSGIGRDIGVIILGIKRADGRMKFNPTSQTLIKEGDTLIVIGQTDKLSLLEKLAKE